MERRIRQYSEYWTLEDFDNAMSNSTENNNAAAMQGDGTESLDDLMTASSASLEFSTSHNLVLTITICTSSVLSLLGSFCIMKMARKKGLHKPYHAIMFWLSICDCFFSISLLLQPFLTPSDELYSIGNQETCTLIGFLFHTFSIMAALQNCVLSFYFVFTIKYGWSFENVASKLQRPSILLVFFIPMTHGLAGVLTQSFNAFDTVLICSLETYPPICGDEYDIECTRGEASDLLINIQAVIIIAASLIAFTGTVMVYCHVRKKVQNSSANSIESSSINQENDTQPARKSLLLRRGGKRTRTTTKRVQALGFQAILYSLVYCNQFLWPLISVLIRAIFEDSVTVQINFTTSFLTFLFYPIQGILNLLVYIRPDYIKYKNRNPHLPTSTVLYRVVRLAASNSLTTASGTSMASSIMHSVLTKREKVEKRPRNSIHISDLQQYHVQRNNNNSNSNASSFHHGSSGYMHSSSSKSFAKKESFRTSNRDNLIYNLEGSAKNNFESRKTIDLGVSIDTVALRPSDDNYIHYEDDSEGTYEADIKFGDESEVEDGTRGDDDYTSEDHDRDSTGQSLDSHMESLEQVDDAGSK